MKRVHCLSAQNCDQIANNLNTLFERSFMMRGVLSMYVTESEFMVPIDVNQLVNILWDLTEEFCPLLDELRAIISTTQPIVVMDEDETDEQEETSE